MNWRIKDLIREKLSFEKWHLNVFGAAASKKVLSKIKGNESELKQMKEAVISAAMGKAAA